MTTQSNAETGALRVHARSSSGEIEALVRFAHEVLPALPASYVERRMREFPIVWTASRGADLVAFQLVDVHVTSGVRLVHVGPLFSKEGAWVAIFEAMLHTELSREQPFCLGVEVESKETERKLRRLLPTTTRPGPSGYVPVDERVLARWFAKSFERIEGLDEDSLTVRVSNPMYPNAAAETRSIVLVPCIEEEDREVIRLELARSVASFQRHRGRSPRVA